MRELVEDLDIVLCVGVLERLGGGLDFLLHAREALSARVLGNEAVEGSNSTSSGVEATADCTVSAGLFVDVLDEGVLGATPFIGDGLLGALGEELDGGVASDALLLSSGLCVFGFGIYFGDEDR